MFCPICRYEYRPGFTKCADCGVDLVDSLPDLGETQDGAGEIDRDSIVMLWSGVDPRVHELISNTLDDAGIEHSDLAATSQFLPAMRDGTEQIRVRAVDFERAKDAIAHLWSDESEQQTHLPTNASVSVNPLKIDQQVFSHASAPEPGGDEWIETGSEDDKGGYEEYQEVFIPEQATAVAWRGGDVRMAKVFKDCLSNIGIGCLVQNENGEVTCLVMPAAERRAKQVIGEIEDGAPMP